MSIGTPFGFYFFLVKIIIPQGTNTLFIFFQLTISLLQPEYQTVASMNGVGPKTHSRLIAEIGNVTRFRNANCSIAFCGIDTPPYDSGQFHADNRHITKRGNKYLRKAGYEIMRNLKTSHPKQDTAVYDYIVQKELEGKAKKAAKIAGLNKFLRIYYARVKEVM